MTKDTIKVDLKKLNEALEEIGLEYDNGYRLLRLISILFLPEKYSYKENYFCIEGIPIGWIMVIISLIIKFL